MPPFCPFTDEEPEARRTAVSVAFLFFAVRGRALDRRALGSAENGAPPGRASPQSSGRPPEGAPVPGPGPYQEPRGGTTPGERKGRAAGTAQRGDPALRRLLAAQLPPPGRPWSSRPPHAHPSPAPPTLAPRSGLGSGHQLTARGRKEMSLSPARRQSTI